MRLPEPAASAAFTAGERRTQCVLAPTPRPYRDSTWAAFSRSGVLFIALLLPFTVSTLAMLQESTRATRTARPSPDHHT